MVQNKEQLLAMASEWVNHAVADLRQQINNFIRMMGTDLDQVADALGVPANELSAIMGGSTNLSLSTLAKILIATDNVLEIKPVSAMPQRGGYPHPSEMPMGGMPMPPHGARRPMGGMPMPPRNGRRPMGEMPMGGFPSAEEMPMGGMPMPPHARPTTRRQAPQNGEAIPYDELSRTQLVSLIQNNRLDNEIDVTNATRGELIDFLEMKSMPTPQPTTNITDQGVGAEATAEHTQECEQTREHRLAQMLEEELLRNPHLRETIERYL